MKLKAFNHFRVVNFTFFRLCCRFIAENHFLPILASKQRTVNSGGKFNTQVFYLIIILCTVICVWPVENFYGSFALYYCQIY